MQGFLRLYRRLMMTRMLKVVLDVLLKQFCGGVAKQVLSLLHPKPQTLPNSGPKS